MTTSPLPVARAGDQYLYDLALDCRTPAACEEHHERREQERDGRPPLSAEEIGEIRLRTGQAPPLTTAGAMERRSGPTRARPGYVPGCVACETLVRAAREHLMAVRMGRGIL